MWILGIAWSSVTVVSVQPPLLPMWPTCAHPHVSTIPKGTHVLVQWPLFPFVTEFFPMSLNFAVLRHEWIWVCPFPSFCACLPPAQQEVFVSELIVVCISSPILFTTQGFKKSDKLVWWAFFFLEFSSIQLGKYSISCSKGTYFPPFLSFFLSLSFIFGGLLYSRLALNLLCSGEEPGAPGLPALTSKCRDYMPAPPSPPKSLSWFYQQVAVAWEPLHI